MWVFVKQITLVWKVDSHQHSFLCTFQEPYIIPGLVFTDFRCLRVSSDMLLEPTSFLKFLLMRFSWLVIKFKKLSTFPAVFLNLLWSLKMFSIFWMYLSLSTVTIELPLSDFWMTICFVCLEHQVLLFINVEAHCCYKCEKKTVPYP